MRNDEKEFLIGILIAVILVLFWLAKSGNDKDE